MSPGSSSRAYLVMHSAEISLTILENVSRNHAGQHGHHDSNTTGSGAGADSHGKGKGKGADYDATGGAVDDRSIVQKLKDKLTPGSDVGKHTKE